MIPDVYMIPEIYPPDITVINNHPEFNGNFSVSSFGAQLIESGTKDKYKSAFHSDIVEVVLRVCSYTKEKFKRFSLVNKTWFSCVDLICVEYLNQHKMNLEDVSGLSSENQILGFLKYHRNDLTALMLHKSIFQKILSSASMLLSKLAKLKIVDISTDFNDIQHISNFDNLKDLTFSSINNSRINFNFLLDIKNLNKLSFIDSGMYCFSKSLFNVIAKLAKLVKISLVNSFVEESYIKDLANMAQLKKLKISNIKNDSLFTCSSLSLFRNIISLNLSYTKMDPSAFRRIGQFQMLSKLNLENCIQNEESLNFLGRLKQLSKLNLSKCKIKIIDLKYLIPLEKLTIVNLNHCLRISKEGIGYISQIENLKTLYLVGCLSLKKEDLEQLHKRKKTLSVHFDYERRIEDFESLIDDDFKVLVSETVGAILTYRLCFEKIELLLQTLVEKFCFSMNSKEFSLPHFKVNLFTLFFKEVANNLIKHYADNRSLSHLDVFVSALTEIKEKCAKDGAIDHYFKKRKINHEDSFELISITHPSYQENLFSFFELTIEDASKILQHFVPKSLKFLENQ